MLDPNYVANLRATLDSQNQPSIAGQGPVAPGLDSQPDFGAGGFAAPQEIGLQTNAGSGHGPIRRRAAGGLDQAAAQAPKKQSKPPALKFDEDKVAKAKTPTELFDSAKPTSRNQLMNWWERQNGSINAAHDKMIQDLGQQPDANRPLTRREKFAALMDFGINLIKASQGRGNDTLGTFATAAGATVEGLQGKRDLEGQQYQEKLGAISKSRQESLKGIGSYGEALRGQAGIDADAAAAERSARPERKTQGSDQGLLESVNGGEFQPVTIDGKRATNLDVGSRGGNNDSRPAEQKKYEHLLSLGMPKEEAQAIAYRQNLTPQALAKVHSSIYNNALRSSYGDKKVATEAANDYIKTYYGDEALEVIRGSVSQSPSQPQGQGLPAFIYDPATGSMKAK